MAKFKLVDRLNPKVTFSLIAVILIGTLLMGWYAFTIALLISLIFSIQDVKVVKTPQKYGLE